jgi:hypothetical protein
VSRLRLFLLVGLLAGAVVGVYVTTAQGGGNNTTFRQVFIYSAKFLCGKYEGDGAGRSEGPVKNANYQTAINVHNPGASGDFGLDGGVRQNARPNAVTEPSTTTTFKKKALVLFREGSPRELEKVREPEEFSDPVELEQDEGLEIDCPDIRAEQGLGADPHGGPARFIKGFVVIEQAGEPGRGSPPLLDVVAAYTGHTFSPNPRLSSAAEGFSQEIETVQPRVRSEQVPCPVGSICPQ